jgi:hypothetical protein
MYCEERIGIAVVSTYGAVQCSAIAAMRVADVGWTR